MKRAILFLSIFAACSLNAAAQTFATLDSVVISPSDSRYLAGLDGDTITIGLIANESTYLYPKFYFGSQIITDQVDTISVTWHSSADSVVSVTTASNGNGCIILDSTGIAKISVTALYNQNLTDTIIIKVTEPIAPASITISQDTIEGDINQSFNLHATILPANTTDTRIDWYISPVTSTVASVTSSGVVYLHNPGTVDVVVVTASEASVPRRDTCHVIVTALIHVDSIALNETYLPAELIGDSVLLRATVFPSNANNKFLYWQSSDPTVATVSGGTSDSCLVKFVAAGTTTITARSTDNTTVYATCNITVYTSDWFINHVTGVKLNVHEVRQYLTDPAYLLMATLSKYKPEDPLTDTLVVWTTTDQTVATVTAGVVTYRGVGTADIIVTTHDGGFKDTCHVTVFPPPVAVTGVTLDPTAITKTLGDAPFDITVTVLPADAAEKSVSWGTSSAAVAYYDVATGKVVVNGAGTATLTVSTYDGNKQATCVVTVLPGAGVGAGSLQTLTVTGAALNPTFSPGITSYSLTVSEKVSKITIHATPAANTTTTFAGDTVVNLNLGVNTIRIIATGPDKIQKVYTLTVTRGVAAIDETETANIYANSNIMYVRATETSTLTVYTLTGRVLRQSRIEQGETTVELPSGLYIVRLESPSGNRLIRKIVIR
ncbi:MAG: Ig-like domain-containing protein [Tannerella sp.]|jgi:uncharacterized protein YjdB|nr:Ig-like domain-containing protein [Tannerella sp.]